jgi:hypothetical protein
MSVKEHELLANVTVISKMSKREVSSLVRFLTDGIAESQDGFVDIRIDLKNEYGGARSLISVNNNSIFGSFGVITDSRIIKEGAN